MSDRLIELEKDFKEVLNGIDFKKYDPFSKTFMKAIFIGQMWSLLKCLEGDVEEELDGAEKYLNEYLDNGETAFRDMARDELKHAGILIKKHYEHADNSERMHLEELENKRQQILKIIEKEE